MEIPIPPRSDRMESRCVTRFRFDNDSTRIQRDSLLVSTCVLSLLLFFISSDSIERMEVRFRILDDIDTVLQVLESCGENFNFSL